MKTKNKKLAVIIFIALFSAVPLIIFFTRSPVLVVADQSSVLLYGASRVRSDTLKSSLTLFRRVKPVIAADDAGDDILQFVIAEVSSRPFCVLFPLRFAKTAFFYREQHPEIPVIIMEGRHPSEASPSAFAIGSKQDDYFLYKTDIAADFYNAGLAASFLIDSIMSGNNKNDAKTNDEKSEKSEKKKAGESEASEKSKKNEKGGTCVIFMEAQIQRQAREAFLKAIQDQEKTIQTHFFTSFSQNQISRISDISCAVLAGQGADFLEKYSDIPVIFFTWMDLSAIPANVTLVFNDSPWVQTVPAVRMAAAGVQNGQIPSIPSAFKFNKAGIEILQKMKKTGAGSENTKVKKNDV